MKTKAFFLLTVLIVLVIGFYILRPHSIDFKEKQLTQLSPGLKHQITNLKTEKNTSYLLLPESPNHFHRPVYFYFNRNEDRELYSYPTAKIIAKNDKIHIYINEQDALNDSEAKPNILIEFQTQSIPELIEVSYQNKRTELKQITY